MKRKILLLFLTVSIFSSFQIFGMNEKKKLENKYRKLESKANRNFDAFVGLLKKKGLKFVETIEANLEQYFQDIYTKKYQYPKLAQAVGLAIAQMPKEDLDEKPISAKQLPKAEKPKKASKPAPKATLKKGDLIKEIIVRVNKFKNLKPKILMAIREAKLPKYRRGKLGGPGLSVLRRSTERSTKELVKNLDILFAAQVLKDTIIENFLRTVGAIQLLREWVNIEMPRLQRAWRNQPSFRAKVLTLTNEKPDVQPIEFNNVRLPNGDTVNNTVVQLRVPGQYQDLGNLKFGNICGPMAIRSCYYLNKYFNPNNNLDISMKASKDFDNIAEARRVLRDLEPRIRLQEYPPVGVGKRLNECNDGDLKEIVGLQGLPGIGKMMDELKEEKNFYILDGIEHIESLKIPEVIQKKMKEPSFYYAFAIQEGMGERSFSSPGRSYSQLKSSVGHWICIFVVKTGADKLNWFIADSIKGHNQLVNTNYHRAKDRIQYIIYKILGANTDGSPFEQQFKEGMQIAGNKEREASRQEEINMLERAEGKDITRLNIRQLNDWALYLYKTPNIKEEVPYRKRIRELYLQMLKSYQKINLKELTQYFKPTIRSLGYMAEFFTSITNLNKILIDLLNIKDKLTDQELSNQVEQLIKTVRSKIEKVSEEETREIGEKEKREGEKTWTLPTKERLKEVQKYRKISFKKLMEQRKTK